MYEKNEAPLTFLEHHCAGDVGPDWQCLSFPVPPGDTQVTPVLKNTPRLCPDTGAAPP